MKFIQKIEGQRESRDSYHVVAVLGSVSASSAASAGRQHHQNDVQVLLLQFLLRLPMGGARDGFGRRGHLQNDPRKLQKGSEVSHVILYSSHLQLVSMFACHGGALLPDSLGGAYCGSK